MSNKLNGGLRQLKENLAGMTFKEKVNHLWTYYKGTLVVVVIVAMLFSLVSTAVINKSTKTLLAGIGINVNISDEGRAYIADSYKERIGTGGLEKVIFTQVYMDNFNDPSNYEESYYTLMSMLALCTESNLDYLLVDDIAIKNLLAHNMFKDLREFFTEEELEEMHDRLVWADTAEDGQPENLVPIAVNISEMPFYEELNTSAKMYFSVVTNTPRMDTLRDFWDYINAWE